MPCQRAPHASRLCDEPEPPAEPGHWLCTWRGTASAPPGAQARIAASPNEGIRSRCCVRQGPPFVTIHRGDRGVSAIWPVAQHQDKVIGQRAVGRPALHAVAGTAGATATAVGISRIRVRPTPPPRQAAVAAAALAVPQGRAGLDPVRVCSTRLPKCEPLRRSAKALKGASRRQIHATCSFAMPGTTGKALRKSSTVSLRRVASRCGSARRT